MFEQELKQLGENMEKQFGFEILRAEAGEALVELKLRPEDMNPYGIPYGGVHFHLADCAGAAALAGLGQAVVTVSANVNYLRGAKHTEKLVCKARVDKKGRTLSFVEVEIEDDQGARLSKFSFVYANMQR